MNDQLLLGIGGLGFATAVSWYLLKLLKQVTDERGEVIRNHIDHSTAAMNNLADAIKDLSRVVQSLESLVKQRP